MNIFFYFFFLKFFCNAFLFTSRDVNAYILSFGHDIGIDIVSFAQEWHEFAQPELSECMQTPLFKY